MLPNKIDIAMSMLEREIFNAAGRFGFAEHPMLKMGINYGKQLYGDKIRAVLASIVESDDTMEAGTETLKDNANDFIDSFQAKLKAKLAQKENDDAQHAS